MANNLKQYIISTLKSYLGAPVIASLSQEDDAVTTALQLGISEFWTIMPLEKVKVIPQVSGENRYPIDQLLAEIPEAYRDIAYFLGVAYANYNPNISTPTMSGVYPLNAIVTGSLSYNTNGFTGSNILRGFTSSSSLTGTCKSQFTHAANTTVSNIYSSSALNTLNNQMTGAMEFRVDPTTNELVFDQPYSYNGLLKLFLAFGFEYYHYIETVSEEVPNPDFDPEKPVGPDNPETIIVTHEETHDNLDQVLSLIPNDCNMLLAKIVSVKFLEMIIAARGSVRFGGEDYTMEVSRLTSICDKLQEELKKMTVEYSRRLMSWQ